MKNGVPESLRLGFYSVRVRGDIGILICMKEFILSIGAAISTFFSGGGEPAVSQEVCNPSREACASQEVEPVSDLDISTDTQVDPNKAAAQNDIVLSLKESFLRQGGRNWGQFTHPQLLLTLKTVEKFPCAGYSLDVQKNPMGKTLTLRIGEAHKGFACANVPSPAVGTVMPEFSGSGQYDLVIERGNRSDIYTVDVSDTQVQVTPQTTPTFTRWEGGDFGLIPQDAIWVRCIFYGRKERDQEGYRCDDIQQSLSETFGAPLAEKIPEGQKQEVTWYFSSPQGEDGIQNIFSELNTDRHSLHVSASSGYGFLCREGKPCQKAYPTDPEMPVYGD